MDLLPVASTNVARVGYDGDLMELHVEFHSGSYYVYEGVPRREFDSLISASSVGGYLNNRIKPRFASRKLS